MCIFRRRVCFYRVVYRKSSEQDGAAGVVDVFERFKVDSCSVYLVRDRVVLLCLRFSDVSM